MCKKPLSKKLLESNPSLIRNYQGVHPNRLTFVEFTDTLSHLRRLLEIAQTSPKIHGDHIQPLESTIRKFQKFTPQKE